MLDRTAESLFWIGRYTERAENHARLIDVYYHVREEADGEDAGLWKRIVGAIGDLSGYEERYREYREREVLHYLTLDPSQPNSLITCIAQARDNLKKIREQLPSDLWNRLNGFYLWLRQAAIGEVIAEPHRFFERVKEGLAAFQGTAVSITLRDHSWHLMESGRYLERSENIVRLLQSVSQTVSEKGESSFSCLLAVLKSVGGYEAYRRLAIEELSLEEVASFLLLQEAFPRSAHYAIASFETSVRAMKSGADRSGAAIDKIIRMAGKARSELSWLDRQDVTPASIGAVIGQLLAANRQLGEAMARAFFSPGWEVIA
ncbi:alpha-E domain-containing protein [Cohnella lubricantis]|uniref:Alpha-E domain-containing protein n=1 Tax=Cohnella lubricantis TaxID=2163172 RepID=A0A841TBG3_9BACL|nr:alpha-E domain-containing protein [Cohnella lubricantis]MBB6676718.1 alpha-E domain-containing protein [Cohnella lubricantis]MBP2117764.1 putative alpha-E superfamily protein [Cohnella lubricantis]